MTDNKTKRLYWGVTQKGEVIYTGTYKMCWEWMILNYANSTLRYLTELGIRLERIA